jgi:predicted SAM-dependent methyltransferase
MSQVTDDTVHHAAPVDEVPSPAPLDNSAIFDAASAGDVAMLRTALLTYEPDVFRVDGVTPLILAALGGHFEAVKLLLEAGADPELTSNEGWTAYSFARGGRHKDVMAILLEAHGGQKPGYDHRASTIRNFDQSRLDIYKKRYDADLLKTKPFYNFGAGTTYHPMWQNVDHFSEYYAGDLLNNIDIDWDIAALGPLQVGSESALAVYTSHTVEHIMDAHVTHMFKEAYRILKPSGFFRVTTPDIRLYYNAWMDKDEHFGLYEGMREDGLPFEICFLNEFATQLRGTEETWDVRAKEVDHVFKTMRFEDALDHYTQNLDFALQQETVGQHVNWWTPEKLIGYLTDAGFKTVYRSGYRQSRCPLMRDHLTFDSTDIETSVYVEAIK